MPGPERAIVRRPDRREQIVAAATAVIGRRGYANTSLKDVAQEAGIAPGLLHYYFPSKEELLLDVVGGLEEALMREWREAVAGIADPLERVTAAVDSAVATCAQEPEFFRLMFELFAVGLDRPAIRVRTQSMLERFVEQIRAEFDRVAERLPSQPPFPDDRYDFPGAIAAAFDGIAFLSLVRDRDPGPAYNAFKALLLAFAALSYALAGKPPPLDELVRLLGSDGRRGPSRATASSG
jgi:AcrR family transcriptional regulator